MDLSRKIRVALTEDHEITQIGFLEYIKPHKDIEVVFTTESGEELIEKLSNVEVDIIILDLRLNGIGGLETARRIREKDKDIKIIIFTESELPSQIHKSLKVGSNGYLTKTKTNAEELYHAITTVMTGAYYCNDFVQKILSKQVIHDNQLDPFIKDPYVEFTDIEKQILKHMCEEKSSEEIASLIGRSLSLVNNYRSAMFKKTNTHNIAGLVKYCLKNEILD